jgi:hypothetical protein
MRAVAKHNLQIRLATLRHGILDAIRRPPRGFERAVRAFLFFKKEEIKAQAQTWADDAKAMAI